MYKINTANGDIIRQDGFVITAPYDEPEYLEYAAWVQQGNTPTEFFEQPPEPVPESVSRFQAQAALYEAGLLEQVQVIMQHPDTPMLSKLAWQNAQEFNRNSNVVLSIGVVLGLDSVALDNLFRNASKIVA